MDFLLNLGAFAALASAFVAIERRQRERRGLSVRLTDAHHEVALTVVNENPVEHRRVASLGGVAGETEIFLDPVETGVAMDLGPQESVTYTFPKSALPLQTLRWLGVWDSMGNVSRCSRAAVSSMRRGRVTYQVYGASVKLTAHDRETL